MFGMGTGVTSSLLSPDFLHFRGNKSLLIPLLSEGRTLKIE